MCFSKWALWRCIFLGNLAYMWPENRHLFPVVACLHPKSNVSEPRPPNDFYDVQCRHRSRINTERFPTSRKVWGHAPLGNSLHFNSPNSPFLGFWLIRTLFYRLSKPFSRFQLGKFKVFNQKYIILLWKIWPIDLKQWKPVWIITWNVLFVTEIIWWLG